MKDGAYENVKDKKSKRTRLVSLFIEKNTAACFNFFGIEFIPQKVLNEIRD